MTIQDVRTLPTEEKIRIMESIWEDLSEGFLFYGSGIISLDACSPTLRDCAYQRGFIELLRRIIAVFCPGFFHMGFSTPSSLPRAPSGRL
jgi:hypothetical protein